MNVLGLLGSGVKKTGGLLWGGLKAAGRNFDRNAIGGIDEAMGVDEVTGQPNFTPAMRGAARSNALMSIGQMLQGQQSLPQGLAQGQQRIFGGWQAGQERKAAAEAKAAMTQLGQEMAGGLGGAPVPAGAGGPPPDRAEVYRAQAAKALQLGQKLIGMGQHQAAKMYFDHAEKMQERADKLQPTPIDRTIAVTGLDGKPALGQMFTDGKFRLVDNAKPPAKWQVINTGGSQQIVDMANPAQMSLTNTPSPDATMTDARSRAQFAQTFPLDVLKFDAAQLARKEQAKLTREGHGISIRGQNMTDARGREMAEISRENKLPSAAEQRAGGFWHRANEAGKNLVAMESTMAEKGLFGQASYKYAPNWLQSGDNQSFRQSQRAFIEAVLRKDSGAAIPAHEYAEMARTYFLEPGDDPKLLEQKRKSRESQLEALRIESGRALKGYGEVQTPLAPKPAAQQESGRRVGTPGVATVPAVGGSFNNEEVLSVRKVK